MAYNSDIFQQQLQDLSRQYQQLQNAPQLASAIAPMAYPQVPVPSRQVQYVEGLAGAIKYQSEKLPYNSSEVIMDKNENIFYMVSKDANGTPARIIPAGRFTIEEIQEETAFLTRKDLEDFKEEIRNLLIEKQKPVVTKPIVKEAASK